MQTHSQLYGYQQYVHTSKQKSHQDNNIFLLKSLPKIRVKDLPKNDKSYQDRVNREKIFGANNNKTISSIVQNLDDYKKNKDLMASLIVLRDQELLKDRYIKLEAFQKNQKVRFVYNDYHQKNTNPGYSRNSLGCFYTR